MINQSVQIEVQSLLKRYHFFRRSVFEALFNHNIIQGKKGEVILCVNAYFGGCVD